MTKPKPMPIGIRGKTIQACNNIVAISNISITSSSYVAITIPADKHCKGIYIKTRSGNYWRLATSASPSTYAKITNPISFDLVASELTTIGYARADSTSDTLEIIYVD